MSNFFLTDHDPVEEARTKLGYRTPQAWITLHFPHPSYKGVVPVDVDELVPALKAALLAHPSLKKLGVIYVIHYPDADQKS